jgi:hypothetical protein
MSDVVLSVPVDAGGVDPLLTSLEKINENLAQINASSKGSFDLMAKSLDKTNKKLKDTDKTFGDIFKKIKLSGLMKMGAGIIGGAAGLAGLSTGALLFGALKNAPGTLGTRYGGAGLGLGPAEMKGLQTASKLMTGKEETLINALTNLSNALTSAEGQGAIAQLGLNATQLKAMSPEKALEAVFNAVKGKGTGIGSEYVRKAFGEVTGLSGQDYNVAEKRGASFAKDYAEFMAKYSSVDFTALAHGAESMVKFQTKMDIVSEKIGGQLADPLSSVLDKIIPYLEKFGDALAKFLDSITQEDIDAFMKNIETVFKFIGDVAGGILTSAGNTKAQQETAARLSAGQATGKDAAALASITLQRVANVFTAEGRAKNAQQDFEMRLANFLNEGYKPEEMRKMNRGLFAEAEKQGYIRGGQYTEKANALRVEVVVKDPAGSVLSSGITTQSVYTPRSPIMGGGK